MAEQPTHSLKKVFTKALASAFPDLESPESYVEITRSTQEKFGHYQCNSAMRLTKLVKKNPRQIAQAVVDQINESSIANLEIAGPGFINITLSPTFLAERAKEILTDPHLGIEHPAHKKRIVIDFSSPNTAKEMHVGHLRSTIIGDSIARTLEFLGHDVLRLNHVGDWGTAFGMLIAYLKREAPKVLSGEEQTDLSHLVQWYKASKKRFDEDSAFKKASQQEVVELQGGDPDARRAWEIICEISRQAYQEIYDTLDIHLSERGESFYNPMLPEVIKDFEEKGLLQVSHGAKCVFLDGFVNRDGEPLPLMLQKSDGGFNYDTTDMAALKHRVADEKADRIIYVTDAGQAQHFKMCFQASEKVGYHDPERVQLDHVPFGLVLGADGKKFKTRSGETVKLADLLEEAVTRARSVVDERSPDLPDEEKDNLARVLGIGAVKYADLSCLRTSDYKFSFDRMLQFEGNTAVFLLYAYVRVAGIKRKVDIDPESLIESIQISLDHPSEVALAMQLVQFGEALDKIERDLTPNRMTDYLYELAERFNHFFRDCRVQGSAEQNSRLLLCEATARVMRTGLHLVGVETVERM